MCAVVECISSGYKMERRKKKSYTIMRKEETEVDFSCAVMPLNEEIWFFIWVFTIKPRKMTLLKKERKSRVLNLAEWADSYVQGLLYSQMRCFGPILSYLLINGLM